MTGTRFSQRGGSILGVLVALLLILAFVSLLVRPWPRHAINAFDVRQRAHLHSIDAALEAFNNEFGAYPPSDANDSADPSYCGAMKLVEALMGQDLMGFHPRSVFRADGLDPNGGAALYSNGPEMGTLGARKEPYLPLENANAWRLVDVYGKGNAGPFREDTYVLCDTFERKQNSGARTGMPILYFRADPNGTMHDMDDPNNPASIYDYRDNLALLKLGVPGEPNAVHPLADPKRFYLNTRDEKATGQSQPHQADSYILLSAGWDGLYGTADDICNFDWKYRNQ